MRLRFARCGSWIVALACTACRRGDHPSEDRGAVQGPTTPSVVPTSPPADLPISAPLPAIESWIAVSLELEGRSVVELEPFAKAIESELARVDGLTTTRTRVSPWSVDIWLRFADDHDHHIHAVREAVNAAQPSLPDAAVPTIRRHRAQARSTWVVLRSSDHDAFTFAAIAERVRESLQARPGVIGVQACVRQPRVVLAIDEQRMHAYGLTAAEIANDISTPVDVDALMQAHYGAALGLDFMTRTTELGTNPCSAWAGANEPAAALQIEHLTGAEPVITLTAAIDEVRAALPGGVTLTHEPWSTDPRAVPPRIHVRVPKSALESSWSSEFLPLHDLVGPSAVLVVFEHDGSAEIIGLTNAAASEPMIRELQQLPNVSAVAELAPWTTLALVGQDTERLEHHASRLAQTLARRGLTPWPELPPREPSQRFHIDEARAETLGVAVSDIERTLAIYSAVGLSLGNTRAPLDKPVVMRIDSAAPLTARAFEARVRAKDREVPLTDLVVVTLEHQLPQLERCDRQRCIGIALEASQVDGLALESLTVELELDPGMTLRHLPRPLDARHLP